MKHIQTHLLELPPDIWNSRARAIEVRKGIKWGQGETSGDWFQDPAWSDLIKKIPRVVWFPESSPPATMCKISTRDRVSSMGVWPGGHSGLCFERALLQLSWSFIFVVIVFLSLYWICYNFASGLSFVFFGPKACGNLSFPTRDWTLTPCIGRQSLNHWTSWTCVVEVKSPGTMESVCEDRRS